jgi:hypothetical protein
MKEGDLVTWLHMPRGGYGYSMAIDAEIIKFQGIHAIVKVKKKSGETVRRIVSRLALREKLVREHGPLCRYCGCPLTGASEVSPGSGVYDRLCHTRDGDMCESSRV